MDDLLERFDGPRPVARPQVHLFIVLHDIREKMQPAVAFKTHITGKQSVLTYQRRVSSKRLRSCK